VLKPEELLHFIEFPAFSKAWEKELGLGDDALAELQSLIMANPTVHPVVRGTGGLRKLRFAPTTWHTGKRGAVRVCYVYFQDHGAVLLLAAYSKSQKDDLTSTERSLISGAITRAKSALDQLRQARREDARNQEESR